MPCSPPLPSPPHRGFVVNVLEFLRLHKHYKRDYRTAYEMPDKEPPADLKSCRSKSCCADSSAAGRHAHRHGSSAGGAAVALRAPEAATDNLV